MGCVLERGAGGDRRDTNSCSTDGCTDRILLRMAPPRSCEHRPSTIMDVTSNHHHHHRHHQKFQTPAFTACACWIHTYAVMHEPAEKTGEFEPNTIGIADFPRGTLASHDWARLWFTSLSFRRQRSCTENPQYAHCQHLAEYHNCACMLSISFDLLTEKIFYLLTIR